MNSGESRTDTGRIRRNSLYFPVDQGIRSRDGFAKDSLLRHVVRGSVDPSVPDATQAEISRVSAGFCDSEPVRSERRGPGRGGGR